MIDPVYLLLMMIGVALVAYTVFGGADFGAGVWELNTRFRASESEKRLIYRAIGPVWEANHVWLIFAMILFWTVFPRHFANVCNHLFAPLLFALAGIVFRGAAYAFRSAFIGTSHSQRSWEVVFGVASTAAPFFFGVALGHWSESPHHVWQLPSGGAMGPGSNLWTSWITPHALYMGFFAVGMCVFLAAVFLYREASSVGDARLQEIWQRRAFMMSLVVGAFSLGGLFVAWMFMPGFWGRFTTSGWPFVALSAVAGISTIVALWRKRSNMATVLAATTVALVPVAWALAKGPVRVPGVASDDGIVNESVQWLLIVGATIGLVIVLPPLIWLFRLFKSAETQRDEIGRTSG